MLSDDEKKIINSLENEYKKLEKEGNILFPLYKQQAKTLLNLITKLQKENETTTKLNANMSKRHLNDIFKIKNYEKQIHLMAEYMEENMDEYQLDEIYAKQYNCNGMERNWTRGKEKEVKDIKQYFERKVEDVES